MDWHETESLLEKLHRDLNQSWEYLRAIAKHETFTDSISTEKKMKSAKFLTEAAERVQVLQVIHRRVMNRMTKLYLYMGMNASQAESQKVKRVMKFCGQISDGGWRERTKNPQTLKVESPGRFSKGQSILYFCIHTLYKITSNLSTKDKGMGLSSTV